MSLLKHLKGAVGGFATGYSAGGLWGGIGGAVIGAVSGPGNPKKSKNVGIQPQYNVTKGKVQLDPNLSPVPMTTMSTMPSPSAPSSTGGFSASGLVRQSTFGNPSNLFRYASAGGGGATGDFFNTVAPPAYIDTNKYPSFAVPNAVQTIGGSPGALYARYYTKKGTPRRIKRNGQPYARPHMNPMNPRAARRAIRRIRGARKLLQRIERSLPRARAHHTSRPRRAA